MSLRSRPILSFNKKVVARTLFVDFLMNPVASQGRK
jgi:hypothetical protein